MSIQLTQTQVSEEIIFENLENVNSKIELLIKLKIVFEQIFRQKFASPNSIFPKLILIAIEKHRLTLNQIKILFFLHNLENALTRKIEVNISETVYSFILKHSAKILEKIVSNYELIPENIFNVKEKIPETINLPDFSNRKHFLKTIIIKAYPYNDEKKYGKLFCRLENGETVTIILYAPWDIFIKNQNLSYGQSAAFYNIKVLEKEGLLLSDRNTMMILSPDIVLDVTDVKSCITNITDYIITRLCCTKKPGIKQIIGNAVNLMFDDLLLNEHEITDDFILNSLNDFKFSLALLGLTSKDILDDVKYHLLNIVKSGLIDKIKNSKSFYVEPSYLSPEFGLSGRIDVLCHEPDEIIELKTGRPKEFGTWINDQTQTALYSLMLMEDPQNQSGAITIFYSKDEKNPIRKVKSKYPNFYLECIKRRNEMIIFDRKLSGFNTDEMKKIVTELHDAGRSGLYEVYRTKLIELFSSSSSGSFGEIVHNYVSEFISFCERERAFQKIEYSSLWSKSEFQKREEFKIIGPLKALKNRDTDNSVTFSIENNDSKFRDGDICIIYDKNKDISGQQLIRGTIKNISRNEVVVSLRSKGIANLFKSNDNVIRDPGNSNINDRGTTEINGVDTLQPLWMLENDFMDISSRKNIWACVDFLDIEERKQKVILGLERPEFNGIKDIECDNKISKVPKQREAIERAVSAKDYFLIQGPPGTGKTTLLAHLIKEILNDPSERILVAAFTNRAVDEIISKLLSETSLKNEIVRLGNEFSTDHGEYSLQRLIYDVPDKEAGEFLKSKRVYFSTTASASYHDIFNLLTFTTSIIDEASQLTEPDTLSIILKTKRFILIGDEKQLPAVISQGNNEKNITSIETNNKILNAINIKRMDISLFERLVQANEENGWDGKILLDKQYRMNDGLLKFINLNFYDSSLCSDESNADSKLDLESEETLINNEPLEFFNLKGYGEKKKNKTEAFLLVKLLQKYYDKIKKDNLDLSIGVIVPFRAQASLISQELFIREINDIKVDTIERFQGGEKDIIFVSFTVYHHSQVPQIQSLIKRKDVLIDRKLNVALTRAKKKLVMIGDAALLSKDKTFKKLIDYCREFGKYYNV